MTVDLFDHRTGLTRQIDAPFPLQPELTLSVWTSTPGRLRPCGSWAHTVYTRTSETCYAFIGTAPDAIEDVAGRLCSVGPQWVTVAWPR